MKNYILFYLIFSFLISSNAQQTTVSALADGQLYKIAVSETGIYKLDFNFLVNELGIDAGSINPRQIKIYGNGGGKLPGLITNDYNNHERDLLENPILIEGEQDGSFDPDDYILFYAEGPDTWQLDDNSNTFTITKNIYSNQNFYFLKISNENGKRFATVPNTGTATYTSTTFDDFQRLEQEYSNLLADWVQTQGGGQEWYGDQFKNQRRRSYAFDFPNLVANEPVFFCVEMAGRAFSGGTYFNVTTDGNTFRSNNFSATSGGSENVYASQRSICDAFNGSSDAINLTIEYPDFSAGSEAWLDYIELNVRRHLIMSGAQMIFRDLNTLAYDFSKFEISNAGADYMVLDITDATNAKIQEFDLDGNTIHFTAATGQQLREFIIFNKNESLLSPDGGTGIANQNVHGVSDVDLAIVYYKDFEEAAQKLAEHRRTFSGYDVATVRIDHIFNEFGSGRQDAVALRDFAKMLYDRNPQKFKYLLLMGDGSFDFRNIYDRGDNFIPVYETRQSLDPINSFPTDDYFALLTAGEGNGYNGQLDIAVGRFPVSTADQAMAVVDKIIHYDSNPNTTGDWRNRLAFVGDDGDEKDGLIHVNPNEEIIEVIERKYPDFNIKKIYLDAFPQISTPGGQKYPSVNEAIDQSIFKGVLAINYFGHGGPKGWAQERVLKIENIINWQNYDRLPLFVTATCTFTGYDDPGVKSAGEEVFLNPNGGAIGLLSTVRAVYVFSNTTLTKAVFSRLFEIENGNYDPIGEIFRRAKNESGANVRNNRKFTLIGDPSMKLALPKYEVETTKIAGLSATDAIPDTVRALQKVVVEGIVIDANGQILEDFNGSIYPTIFDKREKVSTLGQDPGSPVFEFEIQENILFKGRATVTNGRFQFTFVVPKDINYKYGQGKISYYAANGDLLDAKGNYQNIIIGQTDPDALADDQGPQVDVFMNTEDFVAGSITDENPVLLVKLADDNGINVAGTSIGHDLIAVLNDNTQNTYILNDFYEAELNDFTKGTARFPLSNLEEGHYTVRVTAWDVANNSGEGYTEFVVANSEDIALQRVLNFPNPFRDQTCFMFEHNMAGQSVDIEIQIFSVSGELVKTIERNLSPSGYIMGQGECIEWNGRNDYGTPLAKGIYIYRVKIEADSNVKGLRTAASDFEKLVIIR